MVEYSNLNIKHHMKANPGIVFSEQNIVRDKGVSYLDDVQKKARKAAANGEQAKLRITRQDYAKQYGGSAME